MSINKSSVIFFGSPEFAIPSLKAIINNKDLNLLAVVTQSGKPQGRGKIITDPPVAIEAKNLGIQVLQPKSLKHIYKDSETLLSKENESDQENELCKILNLKPDFGVVVAYGKIIPKLILEQTKFGFLNVHPSSLPRWRGAAPIQHTIFSGDKTTSVCIIKLIEELDAGPIYKQENLVLNDNENFLSLHNKTADIGAKLLTETISEIVSGTANPTEQKLDGLTYANKWEKSDCKINWNESAKICLNRINASYPKPGAFTLFQNKILKITKSKLPNENFSNSQKAGSLILISDNRLGVKCGDGSILELEEIQLEGKNKIHVKDFLNMNKFREKIRDDEFIFL